MRSAKLAARVLARLFLAASAFALLLAVALVTSVPCVGLAIAVIRSFGNIVVCNTGLHLDGLLVVTGMDNISLHC